MIGFLSVIKPPGMTSSDVVVTVRKLLPRGVKIGHAGTLDPMAAGVLPLMIGKATRLFDEATGQDKQYVAGLRFGWETDTGDAQGNPTQWGGGRPKDGELSRALQSFVGEREQTPPAYSALKQDGKRLYQLAREGITVQKPPRQITLSECVLQRRLSPEEALIRVTCSKGTYIRVLCEDIGRKLGCPAHMGFLLRTRAGMFTLSNAVPLEDLSAHSLALSLLPPDFPLGHLPAVHVDPQGAHACRNGNPLPGAWLQGASALPEGQRMRLYFNDEFVGLGTRNDRGCVFSAMLKDWEAP